MTPSCTPFFQTLQRLSAKSDCPEHTERGKPIREIARDTGCHASTILRQVRRLEMCREDPLVDAALRDLGAAAENPPAKDSDAMPFDEASLHREARRVLRRLSESGAVLAIADGMENAVVVRDLGEGGVARTCVVSHAVARAMAVQDWIACDIPERISRYRITSTGRSMLQRLLAEQENKVLGFAEQQATFSTGAAAGAELEAMEQDPRSRRGRYLLAESPLTVLARRRGPDGTPFLSEGLVAAGERLREDYELSQIGSRDGRNWEAFLEGRMPANAVDMTSPARAKLAAALRDLGPGLGDVALRCCCYLEGLETAEQRLGWSARSGKIVLHIALQRLKRHYAERAALGGDLIG
jgi:transposase-like protein